MKTFRDVLSNFRHGVTVVRTTYEGELTEAAMSFTVTGTEEVSGIKCWAVDIVLSSAETGNQTVKAWVGIDDGKIYRLSIPGQGVLEYPQSDSIGQMLLAGVLAPFTMFQGSIEETELKVTTEGIVSIKGWNVLDSGRTTVTISGRDYSAYYAKASSTSPELGVQEVEFTLANLLKDRWYVVYVAWVDNEGNTGEIELTELEPAT